MNLRCRKCGEFFESYEHLAHHQVDCLRDRLRRRHRFVEGDRTTRWCDNCGTMTTQELGCAGSDDWHCCKCEL